MMLRLRKFARDAKAATAVEYGLILAVMCLGALGAFSAIDSRNGSIWGNLVDRIPSN